MVSKPASRRSVCEEHSVTPHVLEADFGTKLGPGSSHSQAASNWAAGQERSPSQIDCALFLQWIGWLLFFDESSPELAASFLPSVLSCAASCTSLHSSWG